MSEKVKISFLGDIMCELFTYRRLKRSGKMSFSSYFDSMQGLFSKSDYVIGNLETVLAGEALKYTYGLYSFNTPDNLAFDLAKSGISLVSTANNHCLDRGMDGLKRTLDVLDEAGVPHTGTYRNAQEYETITYLGSDEDRVAIIACTGSTNFASGRYELSEEEGYAIDLLYPQRMRFYGGPLPKASPVKKLLGSVFSDEQKVALKKLAGISLRQVKVDDEYDAEGIQHYLERIGKKIETAKANARAVVLMPHIGGQFNAVPGACTEYVVDRLYHAGADAIIASHPHIVQKCEVREGVPIAYSLGNYSMSPNSVYIPHDLKPEYGVVLHVYFDGGLISELGFSIIKIIEEDELKVVPVRYLFERCSSREESRRLMDDVAAIYERFSQTRYEFDDVLGEYRLWVREI